MAAAKMNDDGYSLTRARWESRSQKYRDSPPGVLYKSFPDIVNKHIHDWQLSRVLAEVPSEQPILLLDVGCGYGRISRELVAQVPHSYAVGIDLSEGYARLFAEGLMNRGAGLVSDARYLPFADNCFDFTVVITTLMYLDSIEEQQKAVTEIARVIRPGGRIVLVENNAVGQAIWTLGSLGKRIFRAISKDDASTQTGGHSFRGGQIDLLLRHEHCTILSRYGCPILTITLPLTLVLCRLSRSIGRACLRFCWHVDRALERWVWPSLFICYVAVKKGRSTA